jgi:hypothetical protein
MKMEKDSSGEEIDLPYQELSSTNWLLFSQIKSAYFDYKETFYVQHGRKLFEETAESNISR